MGLEFDFSAASLDRLTSLVLRTTPSAQALSAETNRAFVDGATWYLGETFRRAKGGRWRYRAGDPRLNLFTGNPYVDQAGPKENTDVPRLSLELLVELADQEHLRRRYEDFIG